MEAARQNPVVRARFADVVWDLESAITRSSVRSHQFARMAVDAYLLGVIEQRFGAPILSTFPLHRALMIAAELNDADLIRIVATRILELGESAPLTSIGIWNMPSLAFLTNRRVPADLRRCMMDQLEERLANAAEAGNEYAYHVAGSSLLKFLRPVEDKSERQRIVKIVGLARSQNCSHADPRRREPAVRGTVGNILTTIVGPTDRKFLAKKGKNSSSIEAFSFLACESHLPVNSLEIEANASCESVRNGAAGIPALFTRFAPCVMSAMFSEDRTIPLPAAISGLFSRLQRSIAHRHPLPPKSRARNNGSNGRSRPDHWR
jgi:hypothetical protein